MAFRLINVQVSEVLKERDEAVQESNLKDGQIRRLNESISSLKTKHKEDIEKHSLHINSLNAQIDQLESHVQHFSNQMSEQNQDHANEIKKFQAKISMAEMQASDTV